MTEKHEQDTTGFIEYKQALDEIEKIVSKHGISEDDYKKIINNKWRYAFSKGYTTARFELINPILDIINKVRKGRS